MLARHAAARAARAGWRWTPLWRRPLRMQTLHRTPVQQRPLFDGRPRGDGYTHFRSAKGNSDSGTRTWVAVLAAVPSSLVLYYLGACSRPPQLCPRALCERAASAPCPRALPLTRPRACLCVLRSTSRPRTVHEPNTDD